MARLGDWRKWRRIACAAAVVLGLFVPHSAALAQQIGAELAGRLNEAQTRAYVLYLRAHAVYEREASEYWSTIEELKKQRHLKRKPGIVFAPDDFVAVQPPRYDGLSLPQDVAKIIAELHPPEPPQPIPVVAEFRAHALREFAFIATPTTEAQFKRHYAEEALSLGLSKDQVVRIYALETGGRGTYDMQAGVDAETRKGRAISTALGYAQLLAANSVDELAKHGETFIARLNALASAPANAGRADLLRAKAA
ncbi:MAG: hypothetical protein JSS20_06060, partial [Proteobacteria bacterium]|nr:hypothetical protein [Pseudomonadota bacterium]